MQKDPVHNLNKDYLPDKKLDQTTAADVLLVAFAPDKYSLNRLIGEAKSSPLEPHLALLQNMDIESLEYYVFTLNMTPPKTLLDEYLKASRASDFASGARYTWFLTTFNNGQFDLPTRLGEPQLGCIISPTCVKVFTATIRESWEGARNAKRIASIVVQTVEALVQMGFQKPRNEDLVNTVDTVCAFPDYFPHVPLDKGAKGKEGHHILDFYTHLNQLQGKDNVYLASGLSGFEIVSQVCNTAVDLSGKIAGMLTGQAVKVKQYGGSDSGLLEADGAVGSSIGGGNQESDDEMVIRQRGIEAECGDAQRRLNESLAFFKSNWETVLAKKS